MLKIMIKVWLLILLLIVGMGFGAWWSCNKSGGTLISNFDCINTSNLKYCLLGGKIAAKPSDFIDLNITLIEINKT